MFQIGKNSGEKLLQAETRQIQPKFSIVSRIITENPLKMRFFLLTRRRNWPHGIEQVVRKPAWIQAKTLFFSATLR